MNIAIVGSRRFPALHLVRELVALLPDDTVVISGGAKGPDSVAEQAAQARGLKTIVFTADWNRFGKSAGLRRNLQIVEAADAVFAFWDGESSGTKDTIETAYKCGIPVEIIEPDRVGDAVRRVFGGSE